MPRPWYKNPWAVFPFHWVSMLVLNFHHGCRFVNRQSTPTTDCSCIELDSAHGHKNSNEFFEEKSKNSEGGILKSVSLQRSHARLVQMHYLFHLYLSALKWEHMTLVVKPLRLREKHACVIFLGSKINHLTEGELAPYQCSAFIQINFLNFSRYFKHRLKPFWNAKKESGMN